MYIYVIGERVGVHTEVFGSSREETETNGSLSMKDKRYYEYFRKAAARRM